MPRLLFTIAANDKGWQLYEGQYGRNWFDNLHPVASAQPKLRDHVWKALEPLLR